jgi:hypothetical protein
MNSSDRPAIVLVHGSFADASGFNEVIQQLQARGYTTVALSNPLRTLVSDAAYVRSVLDTVEGPVVLVAHSYGGMGSPTLPPATRTSRHSSTSTASHQPKVKLPSTWRTSFPAAGSPPTI